MLRQHVINPLWITPPAWFALDPKAPEEPSESTEDFIYHRPVLQREVLEQLNPKAGLVILDGTCGGGGHTDSITAKYSGDTNYSTSTSAAVSVTIQ